MRRYNKICEMKRLSHKMDNDFSLNSAKRRQ